MRRRSKRRSPAFIILAFFVSLLLILGVAFVVVPIATGKQPGPAAIFALFEAKPAKPSQPQPQQAAKDYFQLWNDGKFEEMYTMLSASSRAQFPQDRFVTRYRNVNTVVGIKSVTADVKTPPKPASPSSAQETSATISYSVDIELNLLGKITEENVLPMVLEGGKWQIDWSPDLIFGGMTDDNRISLVTSAAVRADIVDRKGKTLASSGKILTVGVVPGAIKDENRVLTALSGYLGSKPEALKALYAKAQPTWWVPLRDFPADKRVEATARLGGIPGIELREKSARVYPNGAIAAHVIGYVAEVNAEELKRLSARGYQEGDRIGKTGIEASMEDTLAGEKGARLVIIGQDGKTVKVIAEAPAKPGKTVHLTIDIDLQRKAEEALGDKVGSVVVLDPRDNAVLALVSRPAYDPNVFVLGISATDWKRLSEDKTLPFQNRATLSAYPTGSIFKVVTMAAGIENGGVTPESQYNSPAVWKLPGTNQTFTDSLPQGHGQLNTIDGLAQSSNVVFYEIAYKLNSFGPTLLPGLARDFGLGQPTGLNGLREAAGTLPDPEWKKRVKNDAWYAGDAVNLGIGQGYFEATPLQMANVYSTLASDGNLRTPLLVRKVGDGAEATTMESELKAKVPVTQATLDAIRQGMKRAAADPKGTAYTAFKGFTVPMAAKTGTAENPGPSAHAWFAGYAPADNPEVVIIVMVESGTTGSSVSAPIARKFLDSYFSSKR